MKRFLPLLLSMLVLSADARAGLDTAPVPSGSGMAGDLVEVLDFSISPQKPIEGDTVTVKIFFRNVGPDPLERLDWRIVRNEEVLGIGAAENVPSARRFFAMATWVAVPGRHQFLGDIDFNNTLEKEEPVRRNNSRAFEIEVAARPVVLAGAALDARRAERAGARFNVRLDDPTVSNCARSGVVLSPDGPTGATLMLRLRCGSPGGRVVLEAFTDFRLQNGWKIRGISENVVLVDPEARWQWIRRPESGSNDPSLVIEVESRGGEGEISLTITIEGPEDKKPY
jgi:hypothetical protein